mgnify:CR=1 FL=1
MTTTYRIAVIPGDGTGLEVVNEGRKALSAAASRFGFALEMTDFDYGGDRYCLLYTSDAADDSVLV